MNRDLLQLDSEERLAAIVAAGGMTGSGQPPGNDTGYEKEIAALAGADIDWDRFIRLASKSKLLPAARNLFSKAACTGLVPENILKILDSEYMLAQARFIKKEADLCELLDALGAEGIIPVVCKGVPLARVLYSDPGTRVSHDIDILVDPKQVEAASGVLERLGYKLFSTLRPKSFYRAYHFHYIFTRGDSMDSVVELHWSLVDPKKGHRMEISRIFEDAVPVDIMGRKVLTPCRLHYMWYLCVHLSYNIFFGLRNLAEIRGLGAGFSPEDWNGLRGWSKECFTLKDVKGAIFLSESLFGGFVSEDSRALFEPGLFDRKFMLSTYYPKGLVWGKVPFIATHEIMVTLFLRDGLREKLRFAGHIVWPDEMVLNEIYFRKVRDRGFRRGKYFFNGLYVLVKVIGLSLFLGPLMQAGFVSRKLLDPERNVRV